MAQREVYAELPSTQDRAVELARQGVAEGSVVVARRQSRGRGRGDRSWASPEGGLYLSVVLRPGLIGPVLPLAIGAELADAVTLEYGVRPRLKWPNDLLAVDTAGTARKLAGILVDLVRTANGSAAAVAGIGLNAHRPRDDLPAGVRERAVALEELTTLPIDLEALERLVVGASVRAARALGPPEGERAVLARVRGLLYGAGEPVTVDGRPVGTLAGVRDDGALEVWSSGSLRALLAGDVRVGVGA